jgi:hypothetical protein
MDKKHSNTREPAALTDAETKDNSKAGPVPDDLSALLSRASLEKSTYREFPPTTNARRTQQASEIVKDESAKRREVIAEPPTTDQQDPRPGQEFEEITSSSQRACEQSASIQDSFDPQHTWTAETGWPDIVEPSNSSEPAEGKAIRKHRSVRGSGSPWPALDNLFASDKQSFDLIQSIVADIKVPLIFVSSLTGGVGVTTISATLGRCLAGWGHPPMLDEAGLPDAIRHFVNGFSERSGIRVELQASLDFGRLNKEAELALFIVVQESLTNIHKHSGSPMAKIVLGRSSDVVTVEVTDMGRGIAERKPETGSGMPFPMGVGISSMKERVILIGGQLEILSTGTGTTVRVRVPASG